MARWLRAHIDLSDNEVDEKLENKRKKFIRKMTELLQSPAAASESWYNGDAECKGKLRKRK